MKRKLPILVMVLSLIAAAEVFAFAGCGETTETDIIAAEADENTFPEDTQDDRQELADSLEEAFDRALCEKLYEMRCIPDNPVNPAGEWNRTNVFSSCGGTLTISDVTQESFQVDGKLDYYDHEGFYIEQRAYYITDTLAIAKFDADYTTREKDQYVAFFLRDGKIEVMATGMGWELGFGNQVSIGGEYVQGEPVYTTNDVGKYFTEQDLAVMEEMLPKWYYDVFRRATREGVISKRKETLPDGREVNCIEAFTPTIGCDQYTLYFFRGRILFHPISGRRIQHRGILPEKNLSAGEWRPGERHRGILLCGCQF